MSAAKPKVLVAMSGGVDSSVAAALLVRAGYEVVGCFMRLGTVGESLDEIVPVEEAGEGCPTEKVQSTKYKSQRGEGGTPLKILHRGCCSISDAADARLVAAELGIPLYVCNFKKDFRRIIDYFVDEYASGRTPNPCIRCNDWLKFGKLHGYAEQLGCAFVASGHYARVVRDEETKRRRDEETGSAGNSVRLLRAVDHSKDQSYVLFGVPRERLGSMLLPIGDLHKTEVRAMARRFGLPVFDKPDSQEICFVPDDDYAGLIERRRPELAPPMRRPGAIVGADGAGVGEHRGQHRFTIGQRRGLGLAGGERTYVVGRDAATNTVTVGPREMLEVSGCVATEANWLVEAATDGGWRACVAKYRYNTPAVEVEYRVVGADEPPTRGAASPSGRTGRFEVRFGEPQIAVAPGQAVVLYDASEPDVVLGGGWIERAIGAA